jgi:hypothetical protein
MSLSRRRQSALIPPLENSAPTNVGGYDSSNARGQAAWEHLLFAGLGRFLFNLKKVLHE